MRRLLALGLLVFVAIPLAAQEETRFTPALKAGDRLAISNINGSVTVTRASGSTAEVVVTKTVKKGDGNLVKAIMEADAGVVRVCTIYLNRDPDRTTCAAQSSKERGKGNEVEVEMRYEVRVPIGVVFEGSTVNGEMSVRGLDRPARINTVNGSITFDGAGAGELQTVNGAITAAFDRTGWAGTSTIRTVNGAITLTLPADASLEVSGSTVKGGVTSDFNVTTSGRWGPKRFSGTLGGGGRSLELETVNGAITIRKK